MSRRIFEFSIDEHDNGTWDTRVQVANDSLHQPVLDLLMELVQTTIAHIVEHTATPTPRGIGNEGTGSTDTILPKEST